MIVGGTRAPVRLVAATGIVGAAAGAHVASGAALPSPLLLAGLVGALTLLMGLRPARWRSPRLSVAFAVLLQPALHGLFDRMPAAGAVPGTTADVGMAVAHLAAAAFGAWWLARGAARLVAAVTGLSARLLPPRSPSVPIARSLTVAAVAARPGRRYPRSAVSRRGPPAPAQLLPVV